MEYKIIYSSNAEGDLRAIYEYIAYRLLSPINAERTTQRIIEEIRSLEWMPNRNPLYEKGTWSGRELRYTMARDYLIFYRVDSTAKTVAVARIFYGGRDMEAQLEETEW